MKMIVTPLSHAGVIVASSATGHAEWRNRKRPMLSLYGGIARLAERAAKARFVNRPAGEDLPGMNALVEEKLIARDDRQAFGLRVLEKLRVDGRVDGIESPGCAGHQLARQGCAIMPDHPDRRAVDDARGSRRGLARIGGDRDVKRPILCLQGRGQP